MLANGDAIFCVFGITPQPPLNGSLLGRFEHVTKAVTPISYVPRGPLGLFGPSFHAVAVDPAANDGEPLRTPRIASNLRKP